MDLTNPKNIIQQLKQSKLRTKKYLGQHFLTSSKVLEKIVKAANLSDEDVVLEIGPGLGALTVELAARTKKVVAVEKDKNLISLLNDNLLEEKIHSRVEIINDDVLKFDTGKLPRQYKLVANLPFQVTSGVLWKFLHEVENRPSSLTVMIQKEVADRLLSEPGQMSLLAVMVQYYGNVELVARVKKTQFFPPPQVDSAVVQINLKMSGHDTDNVLFFKLVKAGFSSKRKKAINNLISLGLSKKEISIKLDDLGLSSNVRAQELSVDDWLKLYQMLYNDK